MLWCLLSVPICWVLVPWVWLTISIVTPPYFLSPAYRAEWSCGKDWSAIASSGTWRTFTPNSGMDVTFPGECPVTAARDIFSAPPVSMPPSYPETPTPPPLGFTAEHGKFGVFVNFFKHCSFAVWRSSFVILLSISSLSHGSPWHKTSLLLECPC